MSAVSNLFEVITGDVFWVDSGANSTNQRGSFNKPYLTIQQAVDAARASKGDLVLVKANHAETITVQIDFDKAGVTVRGLGKGNSRPTLTIGAAVDGIDVSAANCTLENIVFPAPTFDAVTADVNVDAAGFTMRDTSHIGSTTSLNKVSFLTITANGDDCLVTGMRGFNGVVDMVSGISLGAASRVEFDDVRIESTRTIGFSTGTFDDTATATDLIINNCMFGNGKTDVAVLTLASNSAGLVANTYFAGTVATIAATVVEGTGANFYQTYCTSNRSKNALLEPPVDAD